MDRPHEIQLREVSKGAGGQLGRAHRMVAPGVQDRLLDAPHVAADGVDHGLDRVRVSDIERMGANGTASPASGLLKLSQRVVARRGGHVPAVGRHAQSQGTTETGARAGNPDTAVSGVRRAHRQSRALSTPAEAEVSPRWA